jgi:hypothetical protein
MAHTGRGAWPAALSADAASQRSSSTSRRPLPSTGSGGAPVAIFDAERVLSTRAAAWRSSLALSMRPSAALVLQDPRAVSSPGRCVLARALCAALCGAVLRLSPVPEKSRCCSLMPSLLAVPFPVAVGRSPQSTLTQQRARARQLFLRVARATPPTASQPSSSIALVLGDAPQERPSRPPLCSTSGRSCRPCRVGSL